MQHTQVSTLLCISHVIKKHGGNYSFAANQHYLEALQKYHGIKIGMRTLVYHMTKLRREGYIKSIRRYVHNADGTINRRTSAVCVTVSGYYKLAKLGVSWAFAIANRLGKKYIPKWKSLLPGHIKSADQLNDQQLQKINEQNRLNFKYPLLPQKGESELFDKAIQAAKDKGVSLYDFVLNKPKKLSPLHNSIKPAAG